MGHEKEDLVYTLVGTTKSGKTDYWRCLAGHVFNRDCFRRGTSYYNPGYRPTTGANAEILTENGVSLILWDTAGSESSAASGKLLYNDTSRCIVCISPCADDSNELNEKHVQQQIDAAKKKLADAKRYSRSIASPFIVITKADLLADDGKRKAALHYVQQQLHSKEVAYARIELTSATENCYYSNEDGKRTDVTLSLKTENRKSVARFCEINEQAEHKGTEQTVLEKQTQPNCQQWKTAYLKAGGNPFTANKIFMQSGSSDRFRSPEAIKLLLTFRKTKKADGASSAVLTESFTEEKKRAHPNNSGSMMPRDSFSSTTPLLRKQSSSIELDLLKASRNYDHEEESFAEDPSMANTPLLAEQRPSVKDLCLTYAQNGGSFARALAIFTDKESGHLKTADQVIATLQARKNRFCKLPFFSGASDKTLKKFNIS